MPSSPLPPSLFFGTTVSEQECPDCPPVSSQCLDPDFKNRNPALCSPPTITGLVVDPSHASVDLGARFHFRAFAQFSNGTALDVSDEAVWEAGAISIARAKGKGLFEGLAVGDSPITATWEDLQGSAVMSVVATCGSAATDVVLLVEVGSWESADFWVQARGVSDSLRLVGSGDTRPLVDQIAVVHFHQSPSVVLDWTQNLPPDSTWEVDNPPSNLKVNLGGALDAARSLLATSRSYARKIVVLFTSGLNTGCTPDMFETAEAIKASGAILVAVGGYPHPVKVGNVLIQVGKASLCTQPPTVMDMPELLTALASPSFSYMPGTTGTAGSVLNRIQGMTCGYVPPPVEPPPHDDPIDNGPVVGNPPPPPEACGFHPTDIVGVTSDYVFGTIEGQKISDHLTQEQIDCMVIIFRQEMDKYLNDLRKDGHTAVQVGGIAWEYTTGETEKLSGARKSTCNPFDGEGDVLVRFNGYAAISGWVCRILNFPE